MSARKPWKKLALAAGVALATLLVAEGATRAWLAKSGAAYSASDVRRELAKMRGDVLGTSLQDERKEEDVVAAEPEGSGPASKRKRSTGYRLHPYLGYDLDRGNAQIEGDLARLAQPDPRRFTILMTGGSVAGNFGGAGMRRLKELLLADERFADAKIVTLNYGRPAYKQPQQLVLVGYLLGLGLQPQVVISLDGFNELAVAASNALAGSAPSHPSLPQWRAVASESELGAGGLDLLAPLLEHRSALLRSTEALERSPLLHSALAGTLALRSARGRERQYVDAVLRFTAREPEPGTAVTLRGPRPPADPAEVLAHSVRQWREGSRSLHALCAARGIRYLHVLQPTLHDADSKPLTPGEIERGTAKSEWIEAARAGYPLLRAAGEELRAAGVPFLDASGVFAGIEEEIYTDACHFNPRGNELLAEAIARVLLDSDLRR